MSISRDLGVIMKLLKVSWNKYDDITKIKFSDNFKSSDWIVQLDVLEDVIGELTQHYNNILLLDWESRDEYYFDEIED